MKSNELKQKIKEGALSELFGIYSDTKRQSERIIDAISKFEQIYGEGRDVAVFSTPGRSEIIGNHTDHNAGCVLAGAIDRDIIAVAAKRDDGAIRFSSEGYSENVIELNKINDPDNFENYTSDALIAGVAKAFCDKSYAIGGFEAYSTTEVLKGSGLSSSAAFEVMIGNILNHFYNEGKIDNKELAHFARFAENVYFGKPCGLMDQMACAVGGFVFIDFENAASAEVLPINFSLTDAGYSLCIVNTGGNHADLNDDYASVPREMRSVAALFGREVLRGITLADLITNTEKIRGACGDRAFLRAAHYVCENDRVTRAKTALLNGDISAFFREISQSGRSSFEYLQNVYTTINVKEQGISVALMLTDVFGDGIGAFRVHGGGFAGTVQAFVESCKASEYCRYMDAALGKGSAMQLRIRSVGACKLIG